jgi:hypothetical protein
MMVQDEDRAMLRFQPQERAIEGVPVVDRDRWVGADRSVERQRPDTRCPSPMAPMLLVTGIHEQPMEPWREALRIAEPWELPPGEEECLLNGVLGAFDIAKDPVRDGVALVAVQVDERGEGDVIAIPSPFDQPSPHVRVSSGTRVGASPTTDGRTRSAVQPSVGDLRPVAPGPPAGARRQRRISG